MKKWLVDICVKEWIPGERTVAYEEAEAVDEYAARRIAFASFSKQVTYGGPIRRVMRERQLLLSDCAAGAAIEID